MPNPTGFTEWGYLGAVVFLVIAFLVFLLRRDKEWREYFNMLRQNDSEASKKVAAVLEKVVNRLDALESKFDRHDAAEMEILRDLAKERKTQPRKAT